MLSIHCSKLKNSPMIVQCIELEGAGDEAVGGAGGRGRGAKEPTPAPPLFLRGIYTQSIEKHVNGIPGTDIVK
jgi:hypothetical protein